MILNRINGSQGWVMNMLMRVPDAPATTSEFLILSTLDILRQEGCQFFSTGTTPAPQLGRIEGLRRISEYFIRSAFKLASKLLNLGGRQYYWTKFNPKTSPTFLAFSRPKIGMREILGLMRAFNVNI
jgi:lysylphosphatidylglycerol synthetase-like protein (DUF2156 family)